MFPYPASNPQTDDPLARAGFEAAGDLLANTPLRPFAPVLQRLFADGLNRIGRHTRNTEGTLFSGVLQSLRMSYDCPRDDAMRIPSSGRAIITANHPFGLAEGVILGDLLTGIRPDVRFMANSLLASAPRLREYVLPVNPFGGPEAVRENLRSLRRCMEWLRGGGLLVVFPAGEVSSLQLPRLRVTDREWTENVARLALRTETPVVPLFFHGSNGAGFHAAGLVHERLRTMLLPQELLNKSGLAIRISVGSPIRPERLARTSGPREATEYLRVRTLLLEGRSRHPRIQTTKRHSAAIARPQDAMLIRAEIERLPAGQRLAATGEYSAWIAGAGQIPRTLLEIGRLRELTFRQAGEGSGASSDLDSFDPYYQHLFVWNEVKSEIVGAYRLTKTDETIGNRGVRGLYTNSLFRLSREFYTGIQPAIELGRSFVRPEYQKGYIPLLLLWKGLGHFVAANPRHRMLFGPVSISRDYGDPSRALIVAWLKARRRDEVLAEHVQPRKTFRSHDLFRDRRLYDCVPDNLASLIADPAELSDIVADLEPDHKGIPILLQHYLSLGGQILEFSVDKNFSNVLDGLIIVDLARASQKQIERYMGRENARQFLALHRTAQQSEDTETILLPTAT
jgi:putative hemolysin